ncbi:MAG: hypothetical protein VX500_09830 [Planctomycetota bacterium]|nr:hypothetical protein [Planctomycetota bacterium]
MNSCPTITRVKQTFAAVLHDSHLQGKHGSPLDMDRCYERKWGQVNAAEVA